MRLCFKDGTDPLTMDQWIQNICYKNGKKNAYNHPRSGRHFNINNKGKKI
jgi:hypothetical protein